MIVDYHMKLDAGIPPDIISNRFVHNSACNNDSLDEMLDGETRFLSMQVAARQERPEFPYASHNATHPMVQPSFQCALHHLHAMKNCGQN